MPARAGVWLLVAGGLAAALFAVMMDAGTPPRIAQGTVAPDFELPRAGGGGALSLEQLRGKLVLLNFWATWCKPCEDEMPAMERLYRSFAGRDFELVAVSVDEDPAAVVAFVKRLGLTFPVLLDSSQQVSATYQTFRFPESLLIGRDGMVLERYVGPKEWDAEAYLGRIRRLLDEPAAG